MIAESIVKELKQISDERGTLTEILRCDDLEFVGFGQVYSTTAYPGVVKAWHSHFYQRDAICCVSGMIKLVLFDEREDSPTKNDVDEYFIGERNPLLILVPKKVWHGFKCISEKEAVVVNIPTKPYNREEPDEFRLPVDTDRIPYDWRRESK